MVTTKYTLKLNEDEELTIQWKSSNSTTSLLYYCTSRYEEAYVRQLTKGVIASAYNKIVDKLRMTTEQVSLNYIVSKNLDFQINLVDGSVQVIGNVLPDTPYIDFNHDPAWRLELQEIEDGNM